MRVYSSPTDHPDDPMRVEPVRSRLTVLIASVCGAASCGVLFAVLIAYGSP